MKAHEYWSVGALLTMLGTFYTGYKGTKSSHKYFAASSLLCMIMAIYTGHRIISKNKKSEDFQFAFHILCIGSDKIGHDFRNFLKLFFEV